MTEIKNRNIFKVYLFVILLIAIFIFNNFVEKAKGQSGIGTESEVFTDLIGIELQVFKDPKWYDLGSTTYAGTSTLDTRNNDNFYLFYNQDPKITVVAGTFYRLKLKNVTSNFTLNFQRYFPTPTSSTFRDLTCDSAGGKIEGNDCIIEGMFTTTTNTGDGHERWSISLIKNNSSSTIYFYLVPSSTAGVNDRGQQYYIMPVSASVTLTNSNPSTSITYSIYYRKLYCPNNLAEGSLTSSPPSTGLSWSPYYLVSRSDFQNGNIFTPRILNISNPASGTYSISIKDSDNNTQFSYNNATLTVYNQITSPEGQRNLRISRCEASSTVSDQFVHATYTIDIDQDASGTPPYDYSIKVYQTVNNELATSAYSTDTLLSYQFSFELPATGTYRATATVKDIQPTTTQASCGNTICGCVYLYRSGTQIPSGWYERCREGENWRLIYQTSDPNNFPYNDDRQNCKCTRNSVDIRCRQR
jgi:hypothetical protein